MYVAATRAAFWLGCSGYWWGEGGSSRLGPSPFLEEVRKSGVAEVSAWADAPEPDAENPLLAERGRGRLAGHPGGSALRGGPRGRRPGRRRALARRRTTRPTPGADGRSCAAVPRADQELAAAWDRDAGLLLAERAQRRGDGATQVPLPARLSVSVAGDAGPGPGRAGPAGAPADAAPAGRQARRGTAFHQWLEQRYGQQLLIDDNALFGRGRRRATTATAAGDLAALAVQVRAGRVGRALAAGGRGAVRDPGRRPAGPRPDRRGVRRRPRGRLRRGRLEDRPSARVRGRTARGLRPARRLPPGLGGARRGAGGRGPGRVLLRGPRPDRPPRRPARRGRPGRADRAGPGPRR